MLNLTDIQQDIASLLETLPVVVEEQAIPDIATVKRNAAGAIVPYIAYQFGDLQQGYRFNMASVRGDDYIMPIYTQAVGPTPKIAREGANAIIGLLLGATFDWTGNIRKRPGGGMFPIVSTNGATEAYMFPASFGLLIQLAEV